jgi:hypothetical protein
MKKKLYYEFSDNGDISKIVMCLEDCMEWIRSETENVLDEYSDDVEYTIIPVWMTEEEFKNLPEACI